MKNALFQEKLTVVRDLVGGICGKNSGTVSKCYTKGFINEIVTVKEDEFSPRVAGICGFNDEGSIALSYNKAEIRMISDRFDPGIGGICGHSTYGEILNCYNRGSLNLEFNPEDKENVSCLQLGGIVSTEDRDTRIFHCYTTGDLLINSSVSKMIDRSRCGVTVV